MALDCIFTLETIVPLALACWHTPISTGGYAILPTLSTKRVSRQYEGQDISTRCDSKHTAWTNIIYLTPGGSYSARSQSSGKQVSTTVGSMFGSTAPSRSRMHLKHCCEDCNGQDVQL